MGAVTAPEPEAKKIAKEIVSGKDFENFRAADIVEPILNWVKKMVA